MLDATKPSVSFLLRTNLSLPLLDLYDVENDKSSDLGQVYGLPVTFDAPLTIIPLRRSWQSGWQPQVILDMFSTAAQTSFNDLTYREDLLAADTSADYGEILKKIVSEWYTVGGLVSRYSRCRMGAHSSRLTVQRSLLLLHLPWPVF